MVKIRLKRMGNKFNAFYRIVAANSKSPRDGRFIEELGYYNPHSKELKIDKSLSFKWLDQGAQLTETTRDLFTREKILEEYNKNKKTKKVVKKSKPRKNKKSKDKTTTAKKSSKSKVKAQEKETKVKEEK